MSALDGNPAVTCSVEGGSAALSVAPAAGDLVDGSDSVDVESVAAREPELQSAQKSNTMVGAGRGKSVSVTLEEPQYDKRRLTSWCWQKS